jgi:hypothetical protein
MCVTLLPQFFIRLLAIENLEVVQDARKLLRLE